MKFLIYIAAFISFLVGVFTYAEGTWIDTFFRWVGLGFFVDFCIHYNLIIITVVFLYFIWNFIRLRIWWIYPIAGAIIYFLLRSIHFLGVK